ncbi:MFS transporter [Bartonella apis]|uniref:MFS transporter, DHA1 family, arabinose polymer transporter n=1 Tax=Bartonella apis TaxID=1686310 RepID=A0A1R0FAI1_9HYPH|nr:MFS transporter [Bartonella apis]MCT6825364.1 MFS transporter [Bartonella apis]MCT6861179.1 MFS transporter [Bartonella apis]OLY43970.1 MFS transporter, DHA1 family, arabinose polymer transporter [Bartonella apis]OLY49042.1 MFS transporter, DHA1 family, arabinose polymer transporter [Bartonella apis]
MPAALWAFAIAAFGIGTTEYIISGLLPAIQADFHISVSAAGFLATSYALGVFFGTPIIIILGSNVEKKKLLLLALTFFIVGNFLTALAPNFTTAIFGRVINSLCHGVFIGIASVLAADLVPQDKRTSAIAFMFSGMTAANFIGVPAGTWFSHVTSWRTTFYLITLIGMVAFVATSRLVPKQPKHHEQSLKNELFVFGDIHVLLAMGITILGPAAFFTSITYIAPMAKELGHFSDQGVTFLLFIFGAGLFVGNYLGGKFADRALMPVLYITLFAQAVVMLFFYFTIGNKIADVFSIFFMAAFGFASVSPIQRLVMDRAKAAGGANLASAVNIGFFNLGNALGSWLGGLVIAYGFGYASPNWAGACLSFAALFLAFLSSLFAKHQAKQKLGECCPSNTN